MTARQTVYLTLDDLVAAHWAIHGREPEVRDAGLLAAALARPQTSVGGADAYPDIAMKAAALLHSLARNRALVDGNKRLAWVAAALFAGMNGKMLVAPTQDSIVELVLDVATGERDDVAEIAQTLRAWLS